MKIISKYISLFLIIVLSLTIGCFISLDIKEKFLDIFLGKYNSITVRYLIIFLIIFIDYKIFKSFYDHSLAFRYKSFYKLFTKNILLELFYISMMIISIFIPLIFIHFKNFMINIKYMVLIIINTIIICLIITSLVRIIDVKIKNKIISSCLFIGFYTILEFITENYNFYFANNIIFDFHNTFDYAYVIKYPFLLLIIMFFILMFLNMLFFNSVQKNNYLLGDNNEEN